MPFWCARVFFFLVGFSSPAYFFFLRLSPVADDDDDDGSGWCCCSFVLETNLEFQILLPRLFFPRAREMQRCVCVKLTGCFFRRRRRFPSSFPPVAAAAGGSPPGISPRNIGFYGTRQGK